MPRGMWGAVSSLVDDNKRKQGNRTDGKEKIAKTRMTCLEKSSPLLLSQTDFVLLCGSSETSQYSVLWSVGY